MERRVRIKQADVARALKGASAAGLKITRVEIDSEGKIILLAGDGTPPRPESELDRWLERRDARSPEGH